MSPTAQGPERLGGLQRAQADHRRLQRLLPAARDDDQQGDEEAALGPHRRGDGRDHRRGGGQRHQAAQHHGDGAAREPGAARGHLHLGGQGEGHRAEAETGDGYFSYSMNVNLHTAFVDV